MFYLSGGDSSDSNNNVERVHPEGGYLYQFLQEQEGVQRTAQTKATFPGVLVLAVPNGWKRQRIKN